MQVKTTANIFFIACLIFGLNLLYPSAEIMAADKYNPNYKKYKQNNNQQKPKNTKPLKKANKPPNPAKKPPAKVVKNQKKPSKNSIQKTTKNSKSGPKVGGSGLSKPPKFGPKKDFNKVAKPSTTQQFNRAGRQTPRQQFNSVAKNKLKTKIEGRYAKPVTKKGLANHKEQLKSLKKSLNNFKSNFKPAPHLKLQPPKSFAGSTQVNRQTHLARLKNAQNYSKLQQKQKPRIRERIATTKLKIRAMENRLGGIKGKVASDFNKSANK